MFLNFNKILDVDIFICFMVLTKFYKKDGMIIVVVGLMSNRYILIF